MTFLASMNKNGSCTPCLPDSIALFCLSGLGAVRVNLLGFSLGGMHLGSSAQMHIWDAFCEFRRRGHGLCKTMACSGVLPSAAFSVGALFCGSGLSGRSDCGCIAIRVHTSRTTFVPRFASRTLGCSSMGEEILCVCSLVVLFRNACCRHGANNRNWPRRAGAA